MVYIFYMSAKSFGFCLDLIESLGILPDETESCLVDHRTANTIMRDYALSMGIQLVVDMSMYHDSINTL